LKKETKILQPSSGAISLMVFDLDGTLAPRKSAIDDEMRALLAKLLERTSVAVMSGAETQTAVPADRG